jgi:hypothetical protein
MPPASPNARHLRLPHPILAPHYFTMPSPLPHDACVVTAPRPQPPPSPHVPLTHTRRCASFLPPKRRARLSSHARVRRHPLRDRHGRPPKTRHLLRHLLPGWLSQPPLLLPHHLRSRILPQCQMPGYPPRRSLHHHRHRAPSDRRRPRPQPPPPPSVASSVAPPLIIEAKGLSAAREQEGELRWRRILPPLVAHARWIPLSPSLPPLCILARREELLEQGDEEAHGSPEQPMGKKAHVD